MPDSPLISPAAAFELMSSGSSRCCWVDCRFDLKDTEAGEREYRAGHLPGAQYANLDRDLSAPPVPGKTGRHPLPDPEVFALTLRQWGINQDTHVIAYDNGQGPFASRLWWMLRWVGHAHQSVLDGGLTQWTHSDFPVETEVTSPASGNFKTEVNPDMVITAEEVGSSLGKDEITVVDCRSAYRYAGHADPMDQPSGHIPGASNQPHGDSLGEDGFFLPQAELRRNLEPDFGAHGSVETVTYCGSGVSACHTALASVHAGLALPRVYIGSWSHWITDPTRPIERSEGI